MRCSAEVGHDRSDPRQVLGEPALKIASSTSEEPNLFTAVDDNHQGQYPLRSSPSRTA